MKNFNILSNARWLATIVLLTMLGAPQTWGADPTETFDFTSSSQWSTWGITVPTSSSSGTDLDDDNDYAFTVGNVTMTFTDGNSTVCRCWKANSGLEFRFYNGSTVTFTMASGYGIKSIQFSSKSSMSVSSPTGGSFSTNTWSPASGTSPTSVTISASGSAKWTSVIVTYSATASCTSNASIGNASLNGTFIRSILTLTSKYTIFSYYISISKVIL